MRPDVVRFFRDKRFLNFGLSDAQAGALKVIYGQELTPIERRAVKPHLRTEYVRREHREAALVVGRRGGKSRISAGIALYESVFGGYEKYLAPGELGVIPVISSSMRQTSVVKNYVSSMLKNSPVLSPYVSNDTADGVELTNGLSLACLPCSSKGIRGFAFPCAVLDELGFWRYEGYVDSDRDVMDAVRPAQMQFANPKLIMISSPWIRRGVLWDTYRRPRRNCVVLQAPTWQWNPNITRADLNDEFEADPAAAAREYGAQFSTAITAKFAPADIERAMAGNYESIPPQSGIQYMAAIDPGGRVDSFTLAIGHIQDGAVIVDLAVEWPAPVDTEQVLHQLAGHLRTYRVKQLFSDPYGSDFLKTLLRQHGINIIQIAFTALLKSRSYSTLGYLLRNGAIALPAHQELQRQLQNIEERKQPGGGVTIGAPNMIGEHDDLADALALLVQQLTPNVTRQARRPVRMADFVRGKRPRMSGGQYWLQRFNALKENPGGFLSIQDIERLTKNGSPQ